MDVRLTGRVALVTGASKGLGLAVTRSFARAGASVAMVARGTEGLELATAALAREGLTRVRTYSCDVSKADALADVHGQIVEDLGKVDILVNNAGMRSSMDFPSITDEAWQADLDLKLFAAIRLGRLVWPGMKDRRWGRIINVLNTMAKAPPPGTAPTSVSRAAGLALTKVMASEGGPHNILVNALLVGVIVSEQWVLRHAANAPEKSFDDYAREASKDVPLGRMGSPEEFANLACFLASDSASYVTGAAINVDGGRSPVP